MDRRAADRAPPSSRAGSAPLGLRFDPDALGVAATAGGRVIAEEPSESCSRAARPLVVVHLMKTGGFSLLLQVLENVERHAVWGSPGPGADDGAGLEQYTSVEMVQALDAEVRTSIEVIMGHFPFAVVEAADLGHATIATVVREPVARVLSHLGQCMATHPEQRGLPIEQVYEDEFLRPRLLRNHQTKMLGMTAAQATVPPARTFGPPHPDLVASLHAEGYFETTRYVLEVLSTPLVWEVAVDERTLARARRNLERVDLLGVHDRYDEFLARLGRHMGWTFGRQIWVNRGSPLEVAPSFRRRIEEDNALDLELYEHACDLVGRR
jgi:hypothetical protein